ncbi:MAG TPA: hypothetical protein ENJ65_00695 [Candidatus Tenderia electrophaga]|uniref:Uncharacterized protein n=1 Tax=Candidatus Tenderia electrophaga TaxID=1748243 RepID=A0A832J5R2_9GAMM|nr:hypothetical protein [Candidatus Tenderia electrophaga]
MRNQVKTELCRYDDAPWAPRVGKSFDWAWRVTRPSGDSITGACNGKKSEVVRKVKVIAKRMQKLTCGDANFRAFKVKVNE